MKFRHSIVLSALALTFAWVPACTRSDDVKPLAGDGDGDGDGDLPGDGDGDLMGDGDGDGTGGGDGDGTGGSLGGMGGTGLGGDPGTGGDQGSGGAATGGMGGVPLMCGGTADACSSYDTSATCATQDGCFTSGVCSDPGGGTDCTSQMNQADCEANSCEWFMPCQPSLACDGIVASTPCNVQQGCEWDPADGGSCIVKAENGCVDIVDQDVCTTIVGCSWAQEAFTCGGTASNCDSFEVSDCSTQAGCSVQ